MHSRACNWETPGKCPYVRVPANCAYAPLSGSRCIFFQRKSRTSVSSSELASGCTTLARERDWRCLYRSNAYATTRKAGVRPKSAIGSLSPESSLVLNEVSLSDRLGTRVSFKQNETRIPNSDPGRPRLVSISQEARDDCSLIDH